MRAVGPLFEPSHHRTTTLGEVLPEGAHDTALLTLQLAHATMRHLPGGETRSTRALRSCHARFICNACLPKAFKPLTRIEALRANKGDLTGVELGLVCPVCRHDFEEYAVVPSDGNPGSNMDVRYTICEIGVTSEQNVPMEAVDCS